MLYCLLMDLTVAVHFGSLFFVFEGGRRLDKVSPNPTE